MKLTTAEKEHIKKERARIALDSRDWSKEPYVTEAQLMEMSGWRRALFLASPAVWRRDLHACVLRNAAHQSNADWINREFLLEALAKQK